MELIEGGHGITPVRDSFYTVTGLKADLGDPRCYPVEAMCKVCGQPIRKDTWAVGSRWYHFSREDVTA